MLIVPTKDSCSSVRTAITSSMLIWSVLAILRCERSWSGKTGPGRGSCQLPQGRLTAQMCRQWKPKRHASPGMPNCGGCQTQAPALQPGVSDKASMLLYRHKDTEVGNLKLLQITTTNAALQSHKLHLSS